jgi:hypothetical protein
MARIAEISGVIPMQAKSETAASRRARLLFGATEYPCILLAVTPGGARIRMPNPVRVWSTVTFAVDGAGAVHGRILWQRGDTVALQFVQNMRWVNSRFALAS